MSLIWESSCTPGLASAGPSSSSLSTTLHQHLGSIRHHCPSTPSHRRQIPDLHPLDTLPSAVTVSCPTPLTLFRCFAHSSILLRSLPIYPSTLQNPTTPQNISAHAVAISNNHSEDRTTERLDHRNTQLSHSHRAPTGSHGSFTPLVHTSPT